jgi:hypothetical protein
LFLSNTSLVSHGELGIELALPARQTFTPGTHEMVRVTFTTPVFGGSQSVTTPVSFGNQPIAELLSDINVVSLGGNFVTGMITLAPSALEGDASPLPNGDGQLNLFDWIQVGRFVAGLDKITNGAEFQRVDCAPRATLGDGILNAQDWVQAGRYAAGLDPLTVAGGPTGPFAPVSARPQVLSPGPSSQVTINSGSVVQGLTVTLPINLQAQGNETALGFSLNFDPTVLQFVGAVQGSADPSAVLYVNSGEAASGQVAILLSLPAGGSTFAPATQEIADVTFLALASATNSAVTFGDQPIPRNISDANALEVNASYVSSSVVVNPPPTLSCAYSGGNATLSWPSWAGDFTLLASGSLTPPITWTNVPVTPQTNGDNVQVTLPASDQQTFFRLYHP